MSLSLFIAILAMAFGLIANLIITENKIYCNQQNRNAYNDLLIAGSILMFFSWILAAQTNSFNNRWLHIVAAAYAGCYLLDVVEGFRVKRNSEQQAICIAVKRSAICVSIIYFVFSFLIS